MKTTYITAALLVCASWGIAQGSDRAARTIILDEAGVRNLRLETELVEERDFESTAFAIGRIEEIPANHSVLSTRVAGRVTRIDVFEGDTVEAGDPVARIETRQLGDPPPSVELRALQGGLVTASHVRLGQPVEPDAELMDISDRSKLWAVAMIPELEAAGVDIGSRARIKVPALGDALMEARLIRFGVDANRDAGTVEGIFELPNPDGRLRPGMRVEFSIVLNERPGVLSVPSEAVQGDPSARVVFIKDFDLEHAFVRVPVVLGEGNDRYVEVESGLFPGDEVVTQGAYSLMFAGGGQAMSLKEALDAAHGHEHNEDGSEMTPEQRKAKRENTAHAHGPGEDGHDGGGVGGWPLLIYAGGMTVLSVVLLQRLLNQKRKNEA